MQRLHEQDGAVFGEIAGSAVVRHYGDGASEYRAVRTAAGIVDRADLAQIRMWGKDPVRMLQGLITNDLGGAEPGQGVYAAMLTPKGKTIAELRAFHSEGADGTEVLLSLPREALAGTVEHLRKFVPPLFARWADITDEIGAIGVYGPRSAELLEQLLRAPTPELVEDDFIAAEIEGSSPGGRPLLITATRYAGGERGFDIFAGSAALPTLWTRLVELGSEMGAAPVGFGALETLRIEAGRPRYGAELTEDTIPTEAYESSGMMQRAISFTKGCYTGQEVIIRIAHRGHVNRHLRGLLIDSEPTPHAGTPLHHPDTGKEVGRVTSACYSPLLQQTIALGYVRRELEPGGSVRLGQADGPTAKIAALPFAADGAGAGA